MIRIFATPKTRGFSIKFMRLNTFITGAWNFLDSIITVYNAIDSALTKREKRKKGHIQSSNKYHLRQSFNALETILSIFDLSTAITAIVNIVTMIPLLVWPFDFNLILNGIRFLISFSKSIHLSRPKKLLNDVEKSFSRLISALQLQDHEINIELINKKIDELKKQGISLNNTEQFNELRAQIKNKSITELKLKVNTEHAKKLITLYQLLNLRRLFQQKEIVSNGIKDKSNRSPAYYLLTHAHREKITFQFVNFATFATLSAGFICMSSAVLTLPGIALVCIASIAKIIFSLTHYIKNSYHNFLVEHAEKSLFNNIFCEEKNENLKKIFLQTLSEESQKLIQWNNFKEKLFKNYNEKAIRYIGENRWNQLTPKEQNNLRNRMLLKTYYDHLLKKEMNDDYYAMNASQKESARATKVLNDYYQTKSANNDSTTKIFFNWLGHLARPNRSNIKNLKEKPFISLVKQVGRFLIGMIISLLCSIVFPIALGAIARQHKKNIRKANSNAEVSNRPKKRIKIRNKTDESSNPLIHTTPRPSSPGRNSSALLSNRPLQPGQAPSLEPNKSLAPA